MSLPKPLNPETTQRTFVVDDDWWLHDPDDLEFEVWERDSEQVETIVAGSRTSVDLVTDRLSIGHYVADLVGLGLTAGTYFIRWYVTSADLEGGVEVSWDGPDFDVLSGGGADLLPGPIYALVSDLRREGVPVSKTDSRCLRALHVASRYVEQYTGRRFVPEAKTLRLDGRGANSALLLEEPIIALSRVALLEGGHEPVAGTDIDRSGLRVYNRHLRLLLERPDDRDSPKVELQFEPGGIRSGVPLETGQGHRWPLGRQDVIVAGAFGFTDPDGSPMGSTPYLVRHATILLALRELELMGDAAARAVTSAAGIKREKTRDQEVEYNTSASSGSSTGAFTGDAEIDRILARYRRPAGFAAA